MKDLIEEVWKRKKIPIRQAYGLSETSPTVYMQPWDSWRRKVGSCGVLIPSMGAKFISIPDESSSEANEPVELPRGSTGELWLKGPNVFLDYHNNPTATANAKTPDGWYKTGDVGYEDEDGFFYVTDRVEELIKYKGSQVAPAELEGLLVAHERVGDVAVVGVENASLGTEVPRAYVVPSTPFGGPSAAVKFGPKEEKEICDWLSKRVAQQKRLRGGVTFVDQIPKSVTGKILRRILRDQAAGPKL